jgi:hypothetical protein
VTISKPKALSLVPKSGKNSRDRSEPNKQSLSFPEPACVEEVVYPVSEAPFGICHTSLVTVDGVRQRVPGTSSEESNEDG